MCRRCIGINPRPGGTSGEDHGGHPPFTVFAGEGLGHKEGSGHDIVGAAQRSIQLDCAVHGPIVIVDLLHIHAINLGVLIVDEALADNHQFLGAVPVSAHVDEHGIGMIDFLQ